nr:U32 family peptidase [Parasulfuritortus cantonensis]
MADPGLMAYARGHHPQLRLHLSVQGSATNYEAINFYRERSASSAWCCAAVLSLAQVENVIENTGARSSCSASAACA